MIKKKKTLHIIIKRKLAGYQLNQNTDALFKEHL